MASEGAPPATTAAAEPRAPDASAASPSKGGLPDAALAPTPSPSAAGSAAMRDEAQPVVNGAAEARPAREGDAAMKDEGHDAPATPAQMKDEAEAAAANAAAAPAAAPAPAASPSSSPSPPAAAAAAATPASVRGTAWTDAETVALEAAGKRVSEGERWEDVLAEPQFAVLKNRTATSIRTKWRMLESTMAERALKQQALKEVLEDANKDAAAAAAAATPGGAGGGGGGGGGASGARPSRKRADRWSDSRMSSSSEDYEEESDEDEDDEDDDEDGGDSVGSGDSDVVDPSLLSDEKFAFYHVRRYHLLELDSKVKVPLMVLRAIFVQEMGMKDAPANDLIYRLCTTDRPARKDLLSDAMARHFAVPEHRRIAVKALGTPPPETKVNSKEAFEAGAIAAATGHAPLQRRSGGSRSRSSLSGLRARGGYKCGKCGQLKRGHVCVQGGSDGGGGGGGGNEAGNTRDSTPSP